jgi:Protein of unknown function (DUF3558)
MNLRRAVPAAPHAAARSVLPSAPPADGSAARAGLRRSHPWRRGARATALAGAVAVALSGCAAFGADRRPDVVTPTAATTPTAGSSAATSGFGSGADDGALPEPCTVLTRAEVTDLTGRAITQIDEDDADPAEPTRYCQWQQDGGQLALVLSRTTETDFRAQIADGQPVDGVGDEAFQQAGHLYVRSGTIQVDVYVHGGDTEDRNLTDATAVAKVVLSKL